MKTRIATLVVALMALTATSFAQTRGHHPSRPSDRHESSRMYYPDRNHHRKQPVSSAEIRKVQEFFWMKYRIRISNSEAERIIITERMNRMLPHPPAPQPSRRK